jgi:radical SAM superfamily enzyme YgiQ (UPF0313 family)
VGASAANQGGKQHSVVVLAPNSFARFRDPAIESQFQLLLKGSNLASLQNLDSLFNSPLAEPRLDNGFKETNPMAGYFLESFLKRRGYEARAVFDWNDDAELERALSTDPIAIALSTTYITDTELLSACLGALREAVGSLPILVGGPYIWKQRIELSLGGREGAQQAEWRDFGVDVLSECLFGPNPRGVLRDAIYIASEFGEHTLLRVLEKVREGKSNLDHLAEVPNLVLPVGANSWHPTRDEAEPVDLDADYTRWDLVESMPRMVPLRASVGCPFRCRYCDFIELHPKVIVRSPDSIAAEIELAKRRSARFFGFIDDNIFLSKRRIKHITNTMLQKELGVVWGGFFRVDRIDEGNIREIAASGCAFGLCGIESGDDEQLTRMGKDCTKDEALRGVELSTEAGISLNLSILIGFPGETRHSIDNTISFLNGVSNDNRGLPSWLAYPFFLLPNTAADSLEYRRQFNLVGRGANWHHDTMSSDEAAERWAPYMFKSVTQLPYHYYSGDAPRWWRISKRTESFRLRKDLTDAFLDHRSDGAVQESFGRLYALLRESSKRAATPAWQSVLAARSLQPGERKTYRGAFG